MIIRLRGSSHYVAQGERLLPKLLSRGEEGSPLKYIMSVILLKKKFGLLIRVWVSVFIVPKLLLRVQTLGAKTTKKCCHVGTLEAFHLWILGAEKLDSCSPPIKLLDFLHLLTNGHSMKPPLHD